MTSFKFQIGDRVHRKHLPNSLSGTITHLIGAGLRIRWDNGSVSNWYLRGDVKLIQNGIDKLNEIL